MTVYKPHIFQKGYYFITFTNINWLPLIALTDAYDLIYSWFDYLRQQDHIVLSYVIMPNHIHLMLAYRGGVKSLNTLVGNGKRFIAYGIVKRLQASGNTQMLCQLEAARSNKDMLRQKRYAVFKNSFDVLHCYSQKFLLQKISYMHANPCSKKWMLTADIIAYPHSSARYYETGVQGVYPVMTSMELENSGWWDETDHSQ